MTIERTDRSVEFVADGIVSQFDYEFRILTLADLKVYVDDVDTTSGWTATGIGGTGGGTITFASPPADTSVILIKRISQYKQLLDLVQYGNFDAESLETALDRLCMMIQEVDDDKSDVGHTHAATDITDLEAYLLAGANNVLYSAEWANKAEDSLISALAGGDEVDDYSALHHANKSSASATASAGSASASAGSASAASGSASAAAGSASTASGHATTADNNRGYAAEWANKAEDSLVSAAAGGDEVDDYSALHWANKAAALLKEGANWELRTSADADLALPSDTVGKIVPLDVLTDSNMDGAFTYAADRWTIVSAGDYQCTGTITFLSADQRATPIVELRVDGVMVARSMNAYIRNSSAELDYQTIEVPNIPLKLTAGQYIEVWVGNGSGTTLGFTTTTLLSTLVCSESQVALMRMTGRGVKGDTGATGPAGPGGSAADCTYENMDANGDVGTGAGQLAIGNHNHAATAQEYTKAQWHDLTGYTVTTSTPWALSDNPNLALTLTTNITMADPTQKADGKIVTVLFVQDATGGRTVAWHANYIFNDFTAPVVPTTASTVALSITFKCYSGLMIEQGRTTFNV